MLMRIKMYRRRFVYRIKDSKGKYVELDKGKQIQRSAIWPLYS